MNGPRRGDIHPALLLIILLGMSLVGCAVSMYFLVRVLTPAHLPGSVVFVPRLGLNAKVIGHRDDMYVIRIEERNGPVLQWRTMHVMESDIK